MPPGHINAVFIEDANKLYSRMIQRLVLKRPIVKRDLFFGIIPIGKPKGKMELQD